MYHISISLKILTIILLTIALQQKVYGMAVGDLIDLVHDGECHTGTIGSTTDYDETVVFYPEMWITFTSAGAYALAPNGTYYSWLTYYTVNIDALIASPLCAACPANTVRDPLTAECVPGCEEPLYYFEPTQTCVEPCTADNASYTSNGGCECDDGFTWVGDICVFGDDPAGDEDGDGIPNYDDPDYDNDGDGIPNGEDEDWRDDHPDYDPNPDEDTYPDACDSLTYWLQDSPVGYWYKSGSLTNCGVVEQNVGSDGETTYISRVDAYTCSHLDICAVKLSSCVVGEFYSVALGGCSLPLPDTECIETSNFYVSSGNGVCQNNYLCEDGVTVYSTEVITCPVDDENTTYVSDEQSFINAMELYGSAKESKQDEIIQNIQITNNSLETINDTLSGVDTTLKHLDDKATVTNNELEDINSMLEIGVENNYRQLADLQGAINSADISNQNGFIDVSNKLDKLVDIDDKLQQLVDKNDTITDLTGYFEGENPFSDTNYTDGSENFNVYSAELNDSFNKFIITDPLGLTAMGSSYVVPEIGFDLRGTNYSLFGASHMTSLDVNLIRAMFMFMAVMSGLFVFFRTV